MSELLFERRDGVAWITFNRPERRNAFTPRGMCLLADAWRTVRDDDTVRVAVITGAGDQAFCAGGDLERLLPLISGARPPDDEWDERLLGEPSLTDVALLRGFDLYKPVIAAVNGWALAGGMELLQATDIRVASTNARFGLSEVKRGVVPGGGSLVRLIRQIPWSLALELLLTGDHVSADDAWRMGFVNRVVELDQLTDVVGAYAATLAANGPLAVQGVKEAVLRTSGLSLDEAFAVEAEISARVIATDDAREGPRAFMEKRPPRFTGR